MGLIEQASKKDSEIRKYKQKLESFPVLEIKGEDDTVIYPHDDLESIRQIAIEKLNMALHSQDGEQIIGLLQDQDSYTQAVLKVWNLVATRGIRLSRILEEIRFEIHDRGFDVFISCKSEDYALAHDLYDYLISNGYRPFLADISLKEIGIDQYTALIGEVIDVCQIMIVFATDIHYIETPYVYSEWHTFVNDINTGHRPNGKLINILSPDIDINNLPVWLRDKQCFTTENYKDYLLQYLHGGFTRKIAGQLREELAKAHHFAMRRIHQSIDSPYRDLSFRKLITLIDSERKNIENHIDRLEYMQDENGLRELCERAHRMFWEWNEKIEKLNQETMY